VQDDAATQTNTAQSGVTPSVAADDDLIEKEWVDQAKKIIEETKDDPYRREQEVGKLQREYIKKRYGRDIGDIGE
jgi:Txe/YoeB family toxin of Txe-Axe toxin-antitoxin module